MAEIIIWRKSIKKKGCCPVCKSRVMVEGYPTENVAVDQEKMNDDEVVLWCKNCWNTKVATVLGTAKRTSDDIVSVAKKYAGFDYSKAEKLLSKDIKNIQDAVDKINELKEENRQLKFQNSMLQGNMTQIKTVHDKEIAVIRAEKEALSKECKEWENAYIRLKESVGM